MITWKLNNHQLMIIPKNKRLTLNLTMIKYKIQMMDLLLIKEIIKIFMNLIITILTLLMIMILNSKMISKKNKLIIKKLFKRKNHKYNKK